GHRRGSRCPVRLSGIGGDGAPLLQETLWEPAPSADSLPDVSPGIPAGQVTLPATDKSPLRRPFESDISAAGRTDVPIEVTMPKPSPTMETGVIAQGLVKVGDQVKEGDVLADIETDKATMPMKSYDDGTIVHIDHAAGEEVALGQRVMVLAGKNEDPQKVAAGLGLGGQAKAAAPAPRKASPSASAD